MQRDMQKGQDKLETLRPVYCEPRCYWRLLIGRVQAQYNLHVEIEPAEPRNGKARNIGARSSLNDMAHNGRMTPDRLFSARSTG